MQRTTATAEIVSRRALAVKARAGLVLEITWDDGLKSVVDLSPWVDSRAALAVLRQDRALFESVAVGEYGLHLVWGDERADIDTTRIWLLEQEQAGIVLTADAFKRWRSRHAMTMAQAGQALGVSRRMIAYYESGTVFIPKSLGLACKGFDAVKRERETATA